MDDEKTVLKKVKVIPTDEKGIDDPKNPDESQLYQIMKLFLNEEEDKKIRADFENGGRGYGSLKEELHERIVAFLKPIQERYNELTDEDISSILKKSTPKAAVIAQKKVDEVFQKV